MQVGRITFEILRPVPIAPAARSRRRSCGPGAGWRWSRRRLSADGEPLVRAPAWRLAPARSPCPPGSAAPTGPASRRARLDAAPGFAPPGPSRRGARLLRHRPGRRLPHGDGVPLRRRRLHRAGPGDGVDADAPAAGRRARSRRRCSACSPRPTRATASAPRSIGSRYLFINVDLTVHLHRMPEGEWVCLDAITIAGAQLASGSPTPRCTTSAGRSGARRRPCWWRERPEAERSARHPQAQ